MATATVPFPTARRRPQLASARGSGLPDVYFVKRIDNSRVRREVDPHKQRQCFTLLGLCSLVFLFGLLLAWQHFQCVRVGYEIEQLKSERSSLAEWDRELRLDMASLSDPQRIEPLARKKLGLMAPAPEQVIRLGGPDDGSGAAKLARNLPPMGESPRGQ